MKMLTRMRKRMKGQKGFTLIELLVVIIIIAILAAIAIPTFLGQRQKAQDAAAKSVVRNAMTTMESAYVDTRDFTAITAAALLAIEPAYTFTAVASEALACNPAAAYAAPGNAVYFFSANVATYGIGSPSASGKKFGVRVNKTSAAIDGINPGTAYFTNGTSGTW
jgi:prepilin-type N-terminal cleavage/methylation domain-containing protein